MRKILFLLCLIPFVMQGQDSILPVVKEKKVVKKPSEFKKRLKREFKFSTFYAAYNGANSISDATTYSVTDGLTTTRTSTPYDYSAVFGIRKIQRFGYEPNIQNRFKNHKE